MSGPSICVVIAARNEAVHLQRVLAELDAQDIDVALCDHGSDDDTPDVAARYRHRLVTYQRLPFDGEFSLDAQLAWKTDVIAGLRHDWVVHHDADESLRGAEPGQTLREAIEVAAAEHYNMLDFDEFVFLPRPGSRGRPADFLQHVHGYYFFQPAPNRLNRAWIRADSLAWGLSGGHHLKGQNLRRSPARHQLRHYIGMSEEHLKGKYTTRRFAQVELDRGWHRKRAGLNEAQMLIPAQAPWLMPWEGEQTVLRTDRPADKQYWHWGREGAG